MVHDVIKALLIDDDPATCERVGQGLVSERGIRLVRAHGLTDASVHLRQQPFDVILLQHRDADDLAPLTWLYGRAPEVPILVISDIDDTAFVYQAVGEGVQDVVSLSSVAKSGFRRTLITAIERKRLERYRIRHARNDELTGLANGLLLEERFERAMARADRHATLVGLVAIDLDQIDHLGSNLSNRLLPLVAERFMMDIRKTDTLARTRGSRFTWLVEGLAAISDISALVDRLPKRLSMPFSIDDRDVCITASVGVAICPFHGRDFPMVHAMAEAAMLDVATVSGDGLLMLPLPALADKASSASILA